MPEGTAKTNEKQSGPLRLGTSHSLRTFRACSGAMVSPKAVEASGEFLGQGDDDARRASDVAESVLVLGLGHLADELGAGGAQPSDGVVDAFDGKHDAPQAQRVRRCDRRF